MARNTLILLGTMTIDGHIYVARRTGSWMAQNVAGVMRTVLVLFLITVLTTAVRQD